MTKTRHPARLAAPLWLTVWVLVLLLSCAGNASGQARAIVRIRFVNKVGDRDLVLRDSSYLNPFGEKYTLTKLRYYVTNLALGGSEGIATIKDSYFLVDASLDSSQLIQIKVPPGKYHSLQFLLGVDSLLNVSGAQSGVLDPQRDMFWTWNSGYVMFKAEGNSPASHEVNQKFEYHIGGYAGPWKVLQNLTLPFGKVQDFAPGGVYTIQVDANLNIWWKSLHEFPISSIPVITTPGEKAREMSENYARMFRVEKISTNLL